MFSTVRNALVLALAALILGVSPKPPASASVLHDAFADGSGRSGPALVRLAGGSFVMGAHPADPEYRTSSLAHVVELSPFAMGEFSVTGAQFAQFLTDRRRTPAEIADLVQSSALVRRSGWQNRPATGVTWEGALQYARWLSRKTGQTYTLPSEAQWEYAARAGSQTAWPWGSTWQSSRLNCNHEHPEPLPAHALPANKLGLKGMPGNVWEWTADCLDLDFYMHSPRRDPVFVNASCAAPVIRGGSFADPAAYCSPGYRVNYFARGSATEIGFRVVRRIATAPMARIAPAVIDRRPLLVGPGGGATLEIVVVGRHTDVPLALQAGVYTAVAPSIANRASAPVADFLEQRGEVPLSLGNVTLVSGLPAVRLGIYVVSPDVSIHAKRMVTIPAYGTVRVVFTVSDLLGKRRYARLSGVLRTRAGGSPVPDATLVYGCYPDRTETRTDARGRFTIDRVDTNRNGTLLIDAPDRRGTPPFDRMTLLIPVMSSTVRAHAKTPWEIDMLDIRKGLQS